MTVAGGASVRRPSAGDTREGFAYAVVAYLLWGGLPFYMKAVGHIPVMEVVAHRIVWSVPLAGLLLVWLGRTGDIRRALRTPVTLAQAALTAALITVNWSIYVWAIGSGHTVDAAFGYYINPLLSVLLGAIVLRERLDRMQIAAILLAVSAVALLTFEAGRLPWVSLGVAVSWSFYALFKKTLPIGPAQGFFVEVLLLAVPAVIFLFWQAGSGDRHFLAGDWRDTTLLLSAGVVTAIPLILYANDAKLLRLSTIGIMQYIAPTFMFLIAVLVFDEPFDRMRGIAFALIWAALALYSWSMLRGRPQPPAAL